MGGPWLALCAIVLGGLLVMTGIAGVHPVWIGLGWLCLAFGAIYGVRGRIPY